jgi:16S rRNA (guanine966-N2)-methyltransferase
MRVIAGSAKGVRLGAVPPGARPVSDMAREGLFSSLGEDVRHASVLDLYAGTGAMGIEALSRGAEEATFVERRRRSADAIRDNLRRTGMSERARVHAGEVVAFLRRNDKSRPRFDLVIADPPYDLAAADVSDVLRELASAEVLAPGATIVLTRAAGSSMPVIPLHWAVRRQLRYGDSLLVVYREV